MSSLIEEEKKGTFDEDDQNNFAFLNNLDEEEKTSLMSPMTLFSHSSSVFL